MSPEIKLDSKYSLGDMKDNYIGRQFRENTRQVEKRIYDEIILKTISK